MADNPSSTWYWNDWDNDRGLLLCSLAAQGLWMRMLSIAARAGGYVSVNGKKCTTEDIALIVGKSTIEIAPLIEELRLRGVFSVTRGGVVYNRRMITDRNRQEVNRENGRKGGMASLRKQRGIFKSPKPRPEPAPSEPPSDLPNPLNPIPLEEDSVGEERASPTGAGAPVSQEDPVKNLWDRGVQILGVKGRGLLGKMRKLHGDVAVIEAIAVCEAEQPSDPPAFFVATLARSPMINGGNGKHPGTYRPGGMASRAEGAHNATEAFIRRHQEDSELNRPPPQPLLDRK